HRFDLLYALHSLPTRRSSDLPQWLTALIIVFILLAFNLLSVELFGELESWFSSIKVFAIIALIVTGIILLVCHTKVAGHAVSVRDRKSTRLNSSHVSYSYAVF